jgi:hypothetical protein
MISKNHHYVPIWYQKRFIQKGSKERKYYLLDLRPERVSKGEGMFYTRRDLRSLGPRSCFAEEDLYTTYFGNSPSDNIEKLFFGSVDLEGRNAVKLFAEFRPDQQLLKASQDLIRYLGAQLFRTPKGLAFFQKVTPGASRDQLIALLPRMTNTYGALWVEGVWEVVNCDKSETKFIVSDHPVTLYNRKVFPKSKFGRYPLDAPISWLGTQTLYALDMSHCLIITHLQFARNPSVPLKVPRANYRLNQPGFFDLTSIQVGRSIDEKTVIAINYIVKKRASRYIAAAYEDWLYPERRMKETLWSKLGDEFFLMPDPRKMRYLTGVKAEFSSGATIELDEFGRTRNQAGFSSRDVDGLSIFTRWQKKWNDEFGPLKGDELKDAFGIPI